MNPVFREIVVGGECHLSEKPTLLSMTRSACRGCCFQRGFADRLLTIVHSWSESFNAA